jgi:hypothetical protein
VQSSDRHLESAERHEAAAKTHEEAAEYWESQGDAERAALQREMMGYELRGAELERRWAAIVERESSQDD